MKKRTTKPTAADLQAFDDLRITLELMRELFLDQNYSCRPLPFIRLCETIGVDPWGCAVVAPPTPKARKRKAK